VSIHGGPAWSATFDLDMTSVIGQPRAVLVYSSVTGTGTSAVYQVVGFAGATVVACNLIGVPVLVMQLSPTIDGSATRVGGTGSTWFIYSGASLSR
jgi:hypothetical protein